MHKENGNKDFHSRRKRRAYIEASDYYRRLIIYYENFKPLLGNTNNFSIDLVYIMVALTLFQSVEITI
jgi:hypothetical protein